MSKIYKLCLSFLALFALMLVTSNSAMAASHMYPVVTKHGHFVVDSNGNCVRSNFFGDKDMCAKVQEVMVMDERIIYFGFDSSMLDSEEKMKLNKLAMALDHHKVDRVKIVGYTDRIGSTEYNQKLSEKRANVVKEYLDGKVDLKSSPVVVRAMGEKDEIKLCKGVYGDEAIKCLAPNRRVEVEIDYYDMVR